MIGGVDVWWRGADGIRLYGADYAPVGEEAGLPVICLHGFTRNSRDFEAVAPWIAARGRRVVAMDMRGRGRSDHDRESSRYTPLVYAFDVLGLMASLGIPRAVFVGTSMGGLITLVIASVKPDAVAAAVLNDVGPEVSPEGLARILRYAGAPAAVATWAEAADYARSVSPGGVLDDAQAARLARRLFREDASGAPLRDYDPAIMAPVSAMPAQAAAPDLWPAFLALAAGRPLLAVRGEDSDILRIATLRRMAAEASDLTSVEVPGVGHAPTLEEPVVLSALAAFLDRAP
jgi:pimeloyl-ACP methyl ester carboxylesterase